jgi:hypothetical protein
MALEARNGTMWIVRALEKGLFFANSRNNALEFDGLDAQIRAGGDCDRAAEPSPLLCHPGEEGKKTRGGGHNEEQSLSGHAHARASLRR